MRWCQVTAPKPKPWLRILGLSLVTDEGDLVEWIQEP